MNYPPAQPPHPQRERDEALLADVTSPPSLEDAQESYDFWQHRTEELPFYKRAERHEAEVMAGRWKERLAQAERDRYGPGVLELLLRGLGVRRAPWLPSGRRVLTWLTVVTVLVLVIIVALIVAVIAFWPDIRPVVHDLLGHPNNAGGG